MGIEIENVEIYDLDQSVKASGYPKARDTDQVDYDAQRALKLAKNPIGSGHPNFLKGIKLSFDLTAGQYFWLQHSRYHFSDIVSSQSKMHKLVSMDIDDQCNQYVDRRAKDLLRKYIEKYQREHCNFEAVVSNCPLGLNLTARITSNYLQEKTIYSQRRHHKLESWQQYCDWLEDLPYSRFITFN